MTVIDVSSEAAKAAQKAAEVAELREMADRVFRLEIPFQLRDDLRAPGIPEDARKFLTNGKWATAAKILDERGFGRLAGELRLQTPNRLDH